MPYNYVDHDLGTTVETVTDWAASIGHALQLARSRNEEFEGWFIKNGPLKIAMRKIACSLTPVCFSVPYAPLLRNALASMMQSNGGSPAAKTLRTLNTFWGMLSPCHTSPTDFIPNHGMLRLSTRASRLTTPRAYVASYIKVPTWI